MRSRNIKCTFYRDADICQLSLSAQLLFISLWSSVDREGKMILNVHQLKMDYPNLSKMNIGKIIEELNGYQKLGGGKFLTVYEIDGVKYLKIYNFDKHQIFNIKEKPHGYPEPKEEHSAVMCQHKQERTSLVNATSDFEECYSAYPRKEGKAQALKHWNAHPRAKADMLKAISNYEKDLNKRYFDPIERKKFTQTAGRFFFESWEDWVETEEDRKKKAEEDRQKKLEKEMEDKKAKFLAEHPEYKKEEGK